MPCQGTNVQGEPCGALEYMVVDGWCQAHRPGGAEHMKAVASMGGNALAAKLAGEAFTAEELPALVTLDDAKAALDLIRVAVLSRRISHAEANAGSKAVAEWVKADGAAATARIVNELTKELDARTAEIVALRKQLGAGPLRVTR